MSYYQIPQFALAIDWETSGYSMPNYAVRHQGISFGAIVFDVKTLEPVEKLYREIKFKSDLYEWSPGAEAVHGLSIKHLQDNGVSQEDAAVDLANLVVKYFGPESIILLGHRVHFDKAFTQQLTKSIDIEFDYHPTTIDSASLSTVLLEISKSDDVFELLGIPPRGKHNALEDIEHTLLAVKRMKEFFLLGVALTCE